MLWHATYAKKSTQFTRFLCYTSIQKKTCTRPTANKTVHTIYPFFYVTCIPPKVHTTSIRKNCTRHAARKKCMWLTCFLSCNVHPTEKCTRPSSKRKVHTASIQKKVHATYVQKSAHDLCLFRYATYIQTKVHAAYIPQKSAHDLHQTTKMNATNLSMFCESYAAIFDPSLYVDILTAYGPFLIFSVCRVLETPEKAWVM